MGIAQHDANETPIVDDDSSGNGIDLVRQIDVEEQADRLLIEPTPGWVTNYAVMTVLAAVIAGLGMQMDSAPIVIGAMLVAPVMRPMLGLGFAAITSVPTAAVLRLITVMVATSAVMVAVGWLVTILIPSTEVGLASEVVSRTAPDVRDLAVALAAGGVGAFAILRPWVAESISGVAIAVALVPPPVAAGIALGSGSMAQAGGAMLLYTTNLIAIILGTVASVSLLQGVGTGRFQLDTRRSLLSAAWVIAVALIVGWALLGSFTEAVDEARADRLEAARSEIRSQLQGLASTELERWIDNSDQPNLGVVTIDVPSVAEDGPTTVSVVLLGDRDATIPPLADLEARISETLDIPTRLSIRLVGISDQVSSVIQPLAAPSPPVAEVEAEALGGDGSEMGDTAGDDEVETSREAEVMELDERVVVTVDGRAAAVDDACRLGSEPPSFRVVLGPDAVTLEVTPESMTLLTERFESRADSVTSSRSIGQATDEIYTGQFRIDRAGVDTVSVHIRSDLPAC